MYLRTPLEIGLYVRERRKQLQWTQGVLAEKVGVSRQWIGELEAGKERVELGLVLKTFNKGGQG
jgi:HTH-type transcriptional regulator/antitoxin HipB